MKLQVFGTIALGMVLAACEIVASEDDGSSRGGRDASSDAGSSDGPSSRDGGSVRDGGSSADGGSGADSGSSGDAGSGEDAGSTPELVCPPAPSGTSYVIDEGGVTFSLSPGKLRLQVCQDDILRIQYTTASTLPAKTSLSIAKTWGKTRFCVAEDQGALTISTARMKAKVDLRSGLVTYTDLADHVLVSESAKTLTPATVQGIATNRVETVFNSPTDEALYGLGQHQGNVMNRKGTTQHLENANTQINLPVLVSNKGYGIFWDNYSKSDFDGANSNRTKYLYRSAAGELVDYYFFYGPSIDRVVAGYRTATGAAPLFPKWAYGLFHSKDAYGSQNELLGVKDGYRNGKIPLDCIVQDWNYWSPYVWGSHFMDEGRYPDPASLVSQMHAANVHTMISIWPLYETRGSGPRKTGELDNFKALDAAHALYPSSNEFHYYDTFNATARGLMYEQMESRLLGKYGWDAVWADNTEPQVFKAAYDPNATDTALGKGEFYYNAYPLQHSKGLYEGWRGVASKKKRVYVLTRSAFSGQQRFATTCWSGDIDSNFPTFAKQIPAGLNFALAGMPYWTTDIGGYWGHSLNWSSSENNEMFTRWFQYGAFCPTFRIHGGGSRELYGNQWSAATKANLLKFDQLRYRLMPYIYSLAWKVTSEGYTIMRHLVFDYPADPKVFDIKDQFLFGPAILVNPVITAGATNRQVYLPAGSWYDFWTGSTVSGGTTVTASAPLSLIPLYVKAGSIVPMGPEIQYATESIDPLEIRVYRGRDGAFTLYEDEGDTYAYETGKSAQITFTWSESSHKLTIGARRGSYDGMPQSRTFNVVFVGANHGAGGGVTERRPALPAWSGPDEF